MSRFIDLGVASFFRPDLTFGLSLGCFFVNLTGLLMGLPQTTPADMGIDTAVMGLVPLGNSSPSISAMAFSWASCETDLS